MTTLAIELRMVGVCAKRSEFFIYVTHWCKYRLRSERASTGASGHAGANIVPETPAHSITWSLYLKPFREIKTIR
jgi:hypothetical protein